MNDEPDNRVPLSAYDIADGIWLVAQGLFQRASRPDSLPPIPHRSAVADLPDKTEALRDTTDSDPIEEEEEDLGPDPLEEPSHPLSLPADNAAGVPGAGGPHGMGIKVPAAPPLPHGRELIRAIRPLVRRVASRHRFVLDEDATIDRAARIGTLMPAFRPDRERWLELALVVDGHPSMVVWRQTVQSLQKLCERLGAFRDVRVWQLQVQQDLPVLAIRANTARRSTRELVDATGRRAILLLTDGVSSTWKNGTLAKVMHDWRKQQPVAVLQMLPARLWKYTGFRGGVRARAYSSEPGVPAARYRFETSDPDDNLFGKIPIPVLTLEPAYAAGWAQLVAGSRRQGCMAYAFSSSPATVVAPEERTGEERVQRFWQIASPEAKQLAKFFAATVLRLPVMRLVQQSLLPQSQQVHLAEVLLGGLMRRNLEDHDPEKQTWEFHTGVRDKLLDASSPSEARRVMARLSAYMQDKFGQCLDFDAILQDPNCLTGTKLHGDQEPFARVMGHVLARMGEKYASAAALLQGSEHGPSGMIRYQTLRKGKLAGKRIVWISDRAAAVTKATARIIREQGEILPATSIEIAWGVLNSGKADAVISDLGIGSDPYGAFVLLDRMRAAGSEVPFLIFSSRRCDEIVIQAALKGASCCSTSWKRIWHALVEVCEIPPSGLLTYLPSKRAAAVKRVLANEGISAERITNVIVQPQTPEPWSGVWGRKRMIAKLADLTIRLARSATGASRVRFFSSDLDRGLVPLATWPGPDSELATFDDRGDILNRAWSTKLMAYNPEETGNWSDRVGTSLALPAKLDDETRLILSVESPDIYDFSARQMLWLQSLVDSVALRMERTLRADEETSYVSRRHRVNWARVPPHARARILLRTAYRALILAGGRTVATPFGEMDSRTFIEWAEAMSQKASNERAWHSQPAREIFLPTRDRFEMMLPDFENLAPADLPTLLAVGAIQTQAGSELSATSLELEHFVDAFYHVCATIKQRAVARYLQREFEADLVDPTSTDEVETPPIRFTRSANRTPARPTRWVLLAGTSPRGVPSLRANVQLGRILAAAEFGLIIEEQPMAREESWLHGYYSRLGPAISASDWVVRTRFEPPNLLEVIRKADAILVLGDHPDLQEILRTARMFGRPVCPVGYYARQSWLAISDFLPGVDLDHGPFAPEELLADEVGATFVPFVLRRNWKSHGASWPAFPVVSASGRSYFREIAAVKTWEPHRSIIWQPNSGRLAFVGSRTTVRDLDDLQGEKIWTLSEGKYDKGAWASDGRYFARWGSSEPLTIDRFSSGAFEERPTVKTGCIDAEWHPTRPSLVFIDRDARCHIQAYPRSGPTEVSWGLEPDVSPKKIFWAAGGKHVGVLYIDGTLQLYEEGELIFESEIVKGPIDTAVVCGDRLLVTTRAEFCVFALDRPEIVKEFHDLTPTRLSCLAANNRSLLFAAFLSRERRVAVFSTKFARRPLLLLPKTGFVRALSWSNDDRLAVLRARGEAEIYAIDSLAIDRSARSSGTFLDRRSF